MLGVVGCQMRDEAWALVPYWWINPGKLLLIVQSIVAAISQIMAALWKYAKGLLVSCPNDGHYCCNRLTH